MVFVAKKSDATNQNTSNSADICSHKAKQEDTIFTHHLAEQVDTGSIFLGLTQND